MTVTVGVPDLLKEIGKLTQRTYDLEQGRGGIEYDSNGSPVFKRGMTVGNDDPIYVDEAVPPPTGLTLEWGSFFENIFITATWNPPTGPGSNQVTQYEAELTEVGVGVVQSQVVGGNSARFNGLKPNQQYSVRVRSINRLSKSSTYTAPVTITTGTDATIPGQVQNVTAGAGQKTVTVWWDENTEADVKNGHGGYECELSLSPVFATTFRAIRTTGTIVSFGDLVTGTTYYVRVRAFDSSGNFGPYSLTKNATPGKASGGDIQNGAVCEDHMCAAGISATHITFGTMDGDRIDVNTLNANRIETSELNAQTITIAGSGMFRIGRTASPFHYMIQDTNGIRLYTFGSAAFTGGTLKVDINVPTGSIEITDGVLNAPTIIGGVIKTAGSGRRVQLDSTNFSDLSFYTGDASETQRGIISVLIGGAGATRQATLESRSPDIGTGVAISVLTSKSADGTVGSAASMTANVVTLNGIDSVKLNINSQNYYLFDFNHFKTIGKPIIATRDQTNDFSTKAIGSEDSGTLDQAGFYAKVSGNAIQWELKTTAGVWWRAVDGLGTSLVPVDMQYLMVDGLKVVGARMSAIAAPTGGATVDAEARSTINEIRNVLFTHGLTS